MSKDEVAALILGGIVGLIVTVLVCAALHDKSVDRWQQEAIDHGAAQYNPTTGNFEWKEKVEDGSK